MRYKMTNELDKAADFVAKGYRQGTDRIVARNCFESGANWALDKVLAEMKQLKVTSRRLSAIRDNTDRVMGYADCMSEVQEIITKLKGQG
jgi:hypothetical protein